MDGAVEKVLREHTEHDRESFQRLDERLDKLEEMIKQVAERQQKQIGFFAGVTATVSALIAAAAFFINWMRN
jgi:ribulose 1,5-bisphosphate carboxylase large subunit-like protein